MITKKKVDEVSRFVRAGYHSSLASSGEGGEGEREGGRVFFAISKYYPLDL